MFKFLSKLPGIFVRWILGQDNSAVASLLRMLAEDFLRSYLQRNPDTRVTLDTIYKVTEKIATMAGVKYDVAERVVQATLHRLQSETKSLEKIG